MVVIESGVEAMVNNAVVAPPGMYFGKNLINL